MKLSLRIYGGLGNQLFQIHTAALLAKIFNYEIHVENAFLSHYQVSRKPDYLFLIDSVNGKKLHQSNSYLYKLSHYIRLGHFAPGFSVNDRNVKSIIQNQAFGRNLLHKFLLMDGYFQNFWTLDLINLAINSISFRATDSSNPKEFKDSVVIHIRGGDFLLDTSHNICTFEYYSKAVLIFRDAGYLIYYIVSDDQLVAHNLQIYLKKTLPEICISVLPVSSAINDFNILRMASAKIVGNSTFGFWSVALSPENSIKISSSLLASRIVRSFSFPNETLLAPY